VVEIVRFSSDAFPAHERIAASQDVYGAVAGLDIAPADPQRFAVQAMMVTFGDVVVGLSDLMPCSMFRRASHLKDGNDDLVLTVPLASSFAADHRGEERQVRTLEGFWWHNDLPGASRVMERMRRLYVALPRRALKTLCKNLDQRAGQVVSADAPRLRLLGGYALTLLRDPAAVLPGAAFLHATHLKDLAALVLGANAAADKLARDRGLRAARLAAVKADIVAHLADPSLSVGEVARRQGISPQYVQKIFNGEETTFTEFVLAQRLERAWHLLLTRAERRISAIALECGFNDISYFNRSFRRRFGVRPSDVRASRIRKDNAQSNSQ
jgi:AraC-like DNA-binding protein